MFRGVSGCSGMFRNVPGCSMFRVLSTPRPDGPVVQKRKIRKPEINSTCTVTAGYLATIYDNRPFRICPATAQVPTFTNYVIQDVKKKNLHGHNKLSVPKVTTTHKF